MLHQQDAFTGLGLLVALLIWFNKQAASVKRDFIKKNINPSVTLPTATSSSCVFLSSVLLDDICSAGKTLSSLTQLLCVCVDTVYAGKMVTMTTAVASVTIRVGVVRSLEVDLTWTPTG